MFVLGMWSKLDLSLDPGELAGFIKGDGMGSIQYIIPRLEETSSGEGEKSTIRERIKL